MPLPELDFGGEEGSEEYMETTDSNVDEEGEAGAATPDGSSTQGRVERAAHEEGHGTRNFAAREPADAEVSTRPSRTALDAGSGGPPSPSDIGSTGLAYRHPSADVGVAGGSRAGSWGQSPFAVASYEPRETREGDNNGGDPDVGSLSASEGGPAEDRSSAAGRTRPTPFQLAAFSPFADAADAPWSPRASEDPAQSPARVSIDSPSTRHRQQPSQYGMVVSASEPAAGSAAAILRSPPRRVAFVSPFAQLACEAASQEPESESGGEEGDDRHLQQRGAAPAAAASPSQATAAAVSANSTDVHVLIEKDQQTPVEACWTVLGTCTKPPSGNIMQNGSSPRSSPSGLASAPSLAQPAVAVGARGHGDAEPANCVQALGAAGAGGAARVGDLSEAVSGATAGMESLSLALPGVMPFGEAVSAVDTGADSDEFDEDEDDATLHTTAWVRL
ncbi:hypothetical protein GPECTOR_1g201 [Gonium pectorale]|uniref:Uncharacterized protein n=1 Tax=Gonium pectorale TaxID=33097 RepID=A0A150H2M1_GONPE|nr:hypothetical protein GPECTOR_1g201 [Gonium pectorale]|eukprot:KXZ56232.1 hypothetical protein GPECTOR_1g201 [Gonium pectorale]